MRWYPCFLAGEDCPSCVSIRRMQCSVILGLVSAVYGGETMWAGRGGKGGGTSSLVSTEECPIVLSPNAMSERKTFQGLFMVCIKLFILDIPLD